MRSSRSSRRARRPSWQVRRATERDAATLIDHRRRMWEEIGGRTVRQLDRADPVYRRWMLREMRAHRFLAYLAVSPSGEVGGSGAVWLQPVQPRPGPVPRTRVPYILSMFTEPSVRGQHVASRLVLAMLGWAKARGYLRVILHASIAGRPVYERLGFENASEMRFDLPARRRRPGR